MKETKKYLVIGNVGEIETKALYLLGATDKRDSNEKIGYFGTGIKYAISHFLAQNIEFEIYSGKNHIPIDLTREKFRDKDIDIINIDGIRSSLTTCMGPHWNLWGAIREVYCNALDEGEHVCYICDRENLPIREGYTTFVIAIDDRTRKIYDNWDNYFCVSDHVLLRSRYSSIMKNNPDKKCRIYRRGILCYEDSLLHSLYKYEFDTLEIGEDRVATFSQVVDSISRFYRNCTDIDVIRDYLMHHNDGNYIENYCIHYTSNFSDQWLEALKGYELVPYEFSGYYDAVKNPVYIKNDLYTQLFHRFKDSLDFVHDPDDEQIEFVGKIIKVTDDERKIINDVMAYLAEASLTLDFTFYIAEMPGKRHVFVDFKTNKAYLSPESLQSNVTLLNYLLIAMIFHRNKTNVKTESFSAHILSFCNGLIEKLAGKKI